MKRLILTVLVRVLIASWLIPACFIFVLPLGYLLTRGDLKNTLDTILDFVKDIWYGIDI